MSEKKSQHNKNNFLKTVQSVLKSDTFSFIIGICSLFLATFMLLAFVFFLRTGASDQNVLESIQQEIPNAEIQIENNTGSIGARAAEYLINQCFGFGSLAFIYFLTIFGLHSMKVHLFNLKYHFMISFSCMIWVSVFLGFITMSSMENSFLYAGGMHGYNIAKWLIVKIGYPGVWLLLLSTLVIIAIAINKKTIEYIRYALNINNLKRKISDKEGRFHTDNSADATTGTKESTVETGTDTTGSSEKENALNPEKTKKSFLQKIGAVFANIFSKKKSASKTTADTTGPAENDTPASESENSPVVEEPARRSADDSIDTEETAEENGRIPEVVPTATVSPVIVPEKTPETRPQVTQPAVNEPDFEVEVGQEEAYVPTQSEPYNPRLDLPKYHFPGLDLMKQYDNMEPTVNLEEQQANKDKIIRTLESFGITISSIRATVGPTVTLYEITPGQGIRIAKIRGLEDDIALSLSALGIRIIAPIPGKGTIGIEVPNSKPKIVSGQSIIGSKKFHESTFELPIALGKTITNEVFMVDLCKMPHILVAGATGQGKSVGLNAIITSLLYKKHPSELKFVLVDPKKVEFSIYSVIEKHFLAKLPDESESIITDVTKVVQTLNSVCVEMDNRYDLLKAAHVRNIKEYNEKFISRVLNPEKGHKFMPYIVVIIDEFGDLIMTAGKEIELPIARIAQLARAVGIHMIIATQRPTTNIITGTIKANFPARIAFRVSSMVDSRTILDRPGANQLIGRGDMLFLQGADPVRVQCAFIDTPEVEKITQFIAAQPGYPSAFYLPEYVGESNGSDFGDMDMGHIDSLFEDAARLIVIHQQGSTSLIQRKFSIGYNRAGRIMDQLEKAGIVGPAQGSKPREVLCIDEMDLEQRLKNVL